MIFVIDYAWKRQEMCILSIWSPAVYSIDGTNWVGKINKKQEAYKSNSPYLYWYCIRKCQISVYTMWILWTTYSSSCTSSCNFYWPHFIVTCFLPLLHVTQTTRRPSPGLSLPPSGQCVYDFTFVLFLPVGLLRQKLKGSSIVSVITKMTSNLLKALNSQKSLQLGFSQPVVDAWVKCLSSNTVSVSQHSWIWFVFFFYCFSVLFLNLVIDCSCL